MFVWERQTRTVERVSVDGGGGDPDRPSGWPSVSADGRFVAFDSYASDLVTGDNNETGDVFVRDRRAGTTERVSVDTGGGDAFGYTGGPSVSADGRLVAFYSFAANLVAGDDRSGGSDIFVRDLDSG